MDASPDTVEMKGIAKSFPGVRALDDVALTLRRGEVHALTGENGSGKSTLARILYGALRPDAGEILIDGVKASFRSPSAALAAGVVAISQEITLLPTLTVTENVLAGHLPRGRGRAINWPVAHRLAREAIDRIGADINVRTRVGDLKLELQQVVEIARAVSRQSRVVILDEATSSLSETAANQLLRIVRQLSAEGVAVLMISHKLREIYSTATQATVLRDGRLVAAVPLPDTDEATLVRLMVGRDWGELYPKRKVSVGREVVKVERLWTADGAVRGMSFDARAGEIVGVAGLVGSGKAELGLALAGALGHKGEVTLEGKAQHLRTPRAAIRAGVAFVPQDRKGAGVLPTRSVRENFSVAWLPRISRRGGILNVGAERRLVSQALQTLSVVASSPKASIVTLSGGNQQKVILGRWLATEPRLLVLSEPTRGIDVRAKSEIYKIVQNMASTGSAILLISSELQELLAIADRILVMYEGRLAGSFRSGEASEELLAQVAIAGAA